MSDKDPHRDYVLRPWVHHKKRRAHFHDYYEPGLYMLTLVTLGRQPLFGTLEYEPEPHIKLSDLGMAIWQHELYKISQVYPMIEVMKACIMPDHLHLILRVRERLATHLGRVVSGFKQGCNQRFRDLRHEAQGVVFEKQYNDRLLFEKGGQLLRWKRYLADNPRRLALKRKNPALFNTISDYEIGGKICQIYGNRFLLDIPDKRAVIAHRRYSEAEWATLCRQYHACGYRGGVLVSAAVAPREKAMLREAFEAGYKIILLRDSGFPELYKPSGEAFYACAAGRLLQISPWPVKYSNAKITRDQCLQLNALAEALAGNSAKL